MFDESIRPRILEQAMGLGLEGYGVTQFASDGQLGEFVIRQSTPEKIGKARGNRVVIKRVTGFAVEKCRRTENPADRIVPGLALCGPPDSLFAGISLPRNRSRA